MSILWFEAHAQQLVGADVARLETALQAAFNQGLSTARDICDRERKDCSSSKQARHVMNISTACLHAMICDGSNMEPIEMPTFENQ